MKDFKETFNKGDVVILKSDNLPMTVEGYFENKIFGETAKTPVVDCCWFDTDDHLQRGRFHQDNLTPLPKEEVFKLHTKRR